MKYSIIVIFLFVLGCASGPDAANRFTEQKAAALGFSATQNSIALNILRKCESTASKDSVTKSYNEWKERNWVYIRAADLYADDLISHTVKVSGPEVALFFQKYTNSEIMKNTLASLKIIFPKKENIGSECLNSTKHLESRLNLEENAEFFPILQKFVVDYGPI